VKFQQLEYETDDAIALVRLNRPDQLNALTHVLEAELREAMEHADSDPSIRAIVLTGAGRAFCAGFDMQELESMTADDVLRRDRTRAYDVGARPDYQTRYSYFPGVSKPIICAINGAAAGLGMIMALYSDFRLASQTAVFATAFAKRGLVAEHGIAWILPRVVGHANAIDLLLTSRKINAAEALSIGLVGRVVAPDDLLPTARDLARLLSRDVSPRSLRVMKRQLWTSPYQTLNDAIRNANEEMYRSLQSDDFKEGVAHFIERRPARFTGN